ncbi:MAG: DUF3575 domain-containing protein [Rikenellaceae bacterium]
MSRSTKILLFILSAIGAIVPNCVVAQVEGVEPPQRSAMTNMYQNPQPWSGRYFAESHTLLDRLYINLGGNIGALWNKSNELDNSMTGYNGNFTVGYRLSPVHIVEAGYYYGNLENRGVQQGMELSYLFDLTSYASRSEEPQRWQLLFKSGVEVGFDRPVSLAINGAMRLQYNMSPSVGVYVEPKMSFFATPSYTTSHNSRSFAYTSISAGLSFRLGNIVDSYKRMQDRFNDPDYEIVPLFAVKSNLLFDLATILNIEFEIPIKNRWSISADYQFPWWIFSDGVKCGSSSRIQLLNANLEGRYWFGKRDDKLALTGWFAGLYTGGGLYDVEYKSEGYQGEFFVATGVSGGFAHTINPKGNLRMEYMLGVGYMITQYRYYESHLGIDDTWHVIRKQTGEFTWFGPTRAKVSLVWMLNRTVLKGGGRR